MWSTKATRGTTTASPVSPASGQSARRVSSPKEATFTAPPATTRSSPSSASAAKRWVESLQDGRENVHEPVCFGKPLSHGKENLVVLQKTGIAAKKTKSKRKLLQAYNLIDGLKKSELELCSKNVKILAERVEDNTIKLVCRFD